MASIDKDLHRSCYEEWMNLQQLELAELLQAQTLYSDDDHHNTELSQLIDKIFQHFEEYTEKRSHLARTRVWSYFAPPWCTSLEISILWIGGCRPSSYIRLIYALSGLEIKSQLSDFLRGNGIGILGTLSSMQLSLIDKLQDKTIREEERLTNRVASLQEDMLDNPFAELAMKMRAPGEFSLEVDEAFEKNKVEMARALEEADRFRIKTCKEMIDILKPVQGVQFLVARKKLCICMHEWGMSFDARE